MDNPIVRLQNKASKLYLTPQINNKGIISQQGYMPLEEQLWMIVPSGDSKTFYIQNVKSKMVMMIDKGAKSGDRITLGTEGKTQNQRWSIAKGKSSGNYFIIKSMENNLVIDNPKSSENVGTNMQIFGENDGDNQQFYLLEYSC